MVLYQIIAAFLAVFDAIGLPGNLLVILTIVLERRFHVMQYILLASLALSDFLLLIFVNSFRIASIAQERWLFGKTMCHLNPFFARYFYLNTVLHLIAVSYERYSAIVKSPLTYDGSITKFRVVLMVIIWVIPIPFCIGPFLGRGQYVYNPEVFQCEQGWTLRSDLSVAEISLVIMFILLPFLMLFFNLSVYKAAKSQANAVIVLANFENQHQEMLRRRSERKTASDVSIIIVAFLLCFLPSWVVGMFRRYVNSIKVPAEFVLVTLCIFLLSSMCNPIIYSIRKREFRKGVEKVLRRIGLCKRSDDIPNNLICANHTQFGVNLGIEGSIETPAPALVIGIARQRVCPSPIPEAAEDDGIDSSIATPAPALVIGIARQRVCPSPIPEAAEDDGIDASIATPVSASDTQNRIETARLNFQRFPLSSIPDPAEEND